MTSRRAFSILLVVAALGAGLQLVSTGVKPAPAAPAPTAASPVLAGNYATVAAYVKANCIECHNDKKMKGDVTLEPAHDEASLLKDRKTWEDVLEKVRAGEMPPKKKTKPAKADSEAFISNIEAMFYRHDLNVPLDPGHVTIRRLNRTEYNNTIRDLCYVDFQPASDFPSDEIGQGFDNIGDVLSISPVLMERYLAAADAIMSRAMPVELPKPAQHRVNWRFLEPALHTTPAKGLRRPLLLNQSLFTHYTTQDDGEYTFSFAVYPEPVPVPKPPKLDPVKKAKDADLPEKLEAAAPTTAPAEAPPEPAQVTLLVDKKEIKSFKVTGGDPKKPMVIETRAKLQEGDHRFEILLTHTPKDDAKWILRVNEFQLTGPPDTHPKSQKMLLACDAKLAKTEKTRQVLQRFATHAYRRPATPEEVDHLVKLAEKTEEESGKWEAGIQMAMEAVLISPKFLFRVELDNRPDSAAAHALDDYQLASRLAYFIWSSMPDDELLDLAGKKQLSANLEAQVRRMLADPKSQALVDNFAMQWLQLRRLKTFAPDRKMFPAFNESLRVAMQTETTMFLNSVFREDRSIIELIDSDYTFLNQDLARFYRIADTNGNPMYQKPTGPRGKQIPQNEFVRVQLTDHARGGLLTQASILSVTSNPTRTSPVKRGKFVLEQILGMPPPPPPANVPPLQETKPDGGNFKISLRQRMEEHRANPACHNCHDKMDGLGFAFENFDAVGGFRTDEAGMAIDPSGAMPDGSWFKGAVELKAILKEQKNAFSRCLTKKLMIYATGRGVEYYDQTAVNKIVAAMEKDNYKFSTLVLEIVRSEPFRLRRGKEQTP